MKNKIYLALFAAAFGFASCESDIDNFMVPDTVGLLNSGVVDVKVYDGINDPTMVYAIKSGKGFNSAVASIAVDDALVTKFNTDNADDKKFVSLTALPSDCYTITVAKVELTNADYRKPFEIAWDFPKLQAALALNPNSVVPLKLTVTTDGSVANGLDAKDSYDATKDRTVAFIRPAIEVPYVEIERSGLQTGVMPTRHDPTLQELYFNINSNFIAQRDIDYTLEIDETLVDDYNQANGTDYKVLPAEAYELDLTGTLKEHLKSTRFMMKFFREALVPDNAPSKFGKYILPIRLKSLSSSQINPEKNALLYAVSVTPIEVSKATWSVADCNSNIADDPGATDTYLQNCGPEALFDGTTTKWWRSVYTVEQPLPYYVTIDLGRKTAIAKANFQIPGSTNKRYANAKEGNFYVSVDGENWTNGAHWVSPSTGTQTVAFDVEAPQAVRYVKFEITKEFKTNISGNTNPYAQGVGELTILGEIATWEE